MNQQVEMKEKVNQTEQWVSLAQQGCVSSFEKLYIFYHKRIFLFAKRMSNSISVAEEIVQETYIKAWQNLSSFRAESQFYTWLRTIATRISIDRLRIKNAKIWQKMSDYEDVYASINSNAGQLRELENLINLLPAGARSIFVLHDIEGYKHDEIAKLIGIASGTSKAQLFRARKLLRESLTKE